jgi:glycosyltransferase involved in cell wall biosynthesis
MSCAEYSIIFERAGSEEAEVSVCISLYNYERYICEALESVFRQTVKPIDLIIADDLSTDGSRGLTIRWLASNRDRFDNILFISHNRNCGLAASRNRAFSLAKTEYVFVLDADNIIYPRCLERCMRAMKVSGADFAYSIIERFNSETGEPDGAAPLMGLEEWSAERLVYGNYIDAMALVRKSTWASVGGYRSMRGWEDYDFWCKCVENGLEGVHVPEILCRYRVHNGSMLNTLTRQSAEFVIAEMTRLHPWLRLE